MQEFSPTGEFVRAFGHDVVAAGPDNAGTAFEECRTTAGDACKAGSQGAGVGQFAEAGPSSLTEDASGAIYTVEAHSNYRMQKFTPQAGPPALSAAVFGTMGAPNGSESSISPIDATIGAGGSVFALRSFPAGTTASCAGGPPSSAESRILELSEDGSELLGTSLACAGLGDTEGLTYDPGSESLFVTSTTGGDSVYVLGATGGPPSATIDDVVAPLTPSAPAMVDATVNPNGPVTAFPKPVGTRYYFEYKLDFEPTWEESLKTEVAVTPAGTLDVPVSGELTRLIPGAHYEVRLVAEKEFGGVKGTSATEMFEAPFPDLPAIVSTNASPGPEPTAAAILEAAVNPGLSATVVRFEYGATPAYGMRTPATNSIGDDDTAHSASLEVTELTPRTTYHFRAIATNFAGTVKGPDQTFTTAAVSSPPAPPAAGSQTEAPIVSPPPGKGTDCGPLGRRSAKLASAANRLRRKAKQARALVAPVACAVGPRVFPARRNACAAKRSAVGAKGAGDERPRVNTSSQERTRDGEIGIEMAAGSTRLGRNRHRIAGSRNSRHTRAGVAQSLLFALDRRCRLHAGGPVPGISAQRCRNRPGNSRGLRHRSSKPSGPEIRQGRQLRPHVREGSERIHRGGRLYCGLGRHLQTREIDIGGGRFSKSEIPGRRQLPRPRRRRARTGHREQYRLQIQIR